ncbi:hypothetical protein BJX70DRAFT_390527 [Aspergillus crustosus]
MRDILNSTLRVRLAPSSIRSLAEPDFETLVVESEAESSSGTFENVSVTVTAPSGSYLEGSYYKYQYTRFVSHLGERVVNQGITTSVDNPGPITLSISGLNEGEHTLLTWHNLWSNPDGEATTGSVSANGEEVASGVEQSVRVDNIWEVQTSYITFSVVVADEPVEIIYTPSGGDGRVYLNGFEIDTPALGKQISFPTPSNRDERLEPEEGSSVVAAWKAPADIESPTYNIYLGTDPESFEQFIEGSSLNKLDTFYWRVDVVSGETDMGLSLPHSIETGPRIIIFDIGVVITTTSRLSVNTKYITLAGQTAPGKGIAIQGYPLGLSGASDNITFQRNMISEALNVAGHQNYPEGTAHGYVATVGGDVASLHHNLIAHAEGRSWSMGGGVDGNANFAGRLDIRNNVVYNFGGRVTDGGTMEVNFVGNLYKQGPASDLTYALQATYEDNLPGRQQYHCAGDSMPGVFDQDSTQFVDDGTGQTSEIACYADISIDPAPAYQKFFDEPFFPSHITEHASDLSYKIVLSDSGVTQPVQDSHDARITQETLDGTAEFSGSVSGKPGLIDNEADVGGLEEFPTVTRLASWDSDDDGIPDWWDGSTGGDGYTVIEGYLNFMAEPHVFVTPGGSVEIDLEGLARGFSEPRFSVEGSVTETGLGEIVVGRLQAVYTSSGESGLDWFTVETEDSEGSVWERRVGVAVFEGGDEGE